METSHQSQLDAEFVVHLTGTQSALAFYVRGLMPGDTEVDEVIQQVNALAWQKRNDFELGTNFRAWIYAIARYEVLNYRKQQARHSRLLLSEELDAIVAQELEGVDDDFAERQSALQECLARLKPANRELLLARYGTTESIAEYAARVGRSLRGVRVTLTRLKSQLAACIERRLKLGELP